MTETWPASPGHTDKGRGFQCFCLAMLESKGQGSDVEEWRIQPDHGNGSRDKVRGTCIQCAVKACVCTEPLMLSSFSQNLTSTVKDMKTWCVFMVEEYHYSYTLGMSVRS